MNAFVLASHAYEFKREDVCVCVCVCVCFDGMGCWRNKGHWCWCLCQGHNDKACFLKEAGGRPLAESYLQGIRVCVCVSVCVC